MDSHYIILLDWLTNNKFNDNWSNTDNKVSIDGEWKKARAAALFDALDADGSGEIDDEEFIEGYNPVLDVIISIKSCRSIWRYW